MPPPRRRSGRQPQNPNNFSDREVREAWDAVQNLNKMLPQLQHFARSITRNPKVIVKVDPGIPSTRGNLITIRPPLGLGKNPPHRRAECGDRDWNGHQKCPACKLREVIEFYLFHEVGHVAKQSQAPCNGTAHDAFESYLAEWHPEGACDHAAHLRAEAPVGSTQLRYASVCNEYLPMIVNCLEDARVNEGVYELLPGMRKVFDLNIEKILEEGIDRGIGDNASWMDAPLDSQFMIGFFLIAAHHEVEGRLDERVVAALSNEDITSICMQAGVAEDSSRIFELGVDAFRVAQTLGFCLVPKCEVPTPAISGPPEEESGPGDPQPGGSDGESSSVPQSDDPGGDGGSPDSGDSGDSSGPTSSGDGDDSASPQLGDESREETRTREGSGSSAEEREGSDNAGPPSDSASGPSGGDESDGAASGPGETADSGGTGVREDADGDDGESDEAESNSDGGSGSESPEGGSSAGRSNDDDLSDDDSGDDDTVPSDGGRTGLPGPGDDGDSGDDSDNPGHGGATESDNESANEPEEGEDSDADGVPGDDLAGERFDETESEDWSADDGDAESAELDSDVDPWATSGLEGDGAQLQPATATDAAESPEPLVTGTPDDVADAIGRFLMHGNPSEEDSSGILERMADGDLEEFIGEIEGKELSGPLEDLLRLAVRQVVFFDSASRYVSGVEVIQWPHRQSDWYEHIPHTDFAPTEALLGHAVLKARRTFEENKRKKHVRNLRSGKINTRVLGRRAMTGDDRVFQKSLLPGRKDYKVIITGDLSGSTDLDGRNDKIKRIMYAQCELLNRLGVPFEAWGHSAYTAPQSKMGTRSYYSGDEFYVYMYPVKTEQEAWNNLAKTKLANLLPIADNLDGHTLEFCRKRAQASQATDKVIIYFTDGAMPAANYDEEKIVLEREIELCKQLGITLLGVGIHTDSPKQYGMNTVRVDSDEDIIKVLAQLEQQLER